jgi:hypothetical protein
MMPLKDRFNYLSGNVGAKLLAASEGMKGAHNVLYEDKDSYAITESGQKKKWLTLALTQEVHLDTLLLANFELYSSTVRRFQLLGSQIYPCQQWALLGEFEANDTRTEQPFHLPQPMYVRFIKLRFLSHHGQEHYWSLSLVRAYGLTDVDKFLADNAQLQNVKEAATRTALPQAPPSEPPDVVAVGSAAAAPAVPQAAEEAAVAGEGEARGAEAAAESGLSAGGTAGQGGEPSSQQPHSAATEAHHGSTTGVGSGSQAAGGAAPDRESGPATTAPADAMAAATSVQSELASQPDTWLPASDGAATLPEGAAGDSTPSDGAAAVASEEPAAAVAAEGSAADADADGAHRPLPASQSASVPPGDDAHAEAEPEDGRAGANVGTPAAQAIQDGAAVHLERLSSSDAGAQAAQGESLAGGADGSSTGAAAPQDSRPRDAAAPTHDAVDSAGEASGRRCVSLSGQQGQLCSKANASPTPPAAHNRKEGSSATDASAPREAEGVGKPAQAVGHAAASLAESGEGANPTADGEAGGAEGAAGLVARTVGSLRRVLGAPPLPSPPEPLAAAAVPLPQPPPNPPRTGPVPPPLPPQASQDQLDAPAAAVPPAQSPPLPSPPPLGHNSSVARDSTPPPAVSVPGRARASAPAPVPAAAGLVAPTPSLTESEARSPPPIVPAASPSPPPAAATVALVVTPSPAGTGGPIPSSSPDPFFRNDPNHIFNVLQSKMRQLELNQSLIHDWLVVWQAQIGSKLKGLNASAEAASTGARAAQASVAALGAEQQLLGSTVRELRTAISAMAPLFEQQLAGPAAPLVALEKRITRLSEAHLRAEHRLRGEMEAMALHHRIELACAIILSLGVSLIVFACCFSHQPPGLSGGHRPIRIGGGSSVSLGSSMGAGLSHLFRGRSSQPLRAESDASTGKPLSSSLRSSDAEMRGFDAAVRGAANARHVGYVGATLRIPAGRSASELSASTLSGSGDEAIAARLAGDDSASSDNEMRMPDSHDQPEEKNGFTSLGEAGDKIPRRHTFPSLMPFRAPAPKGEKESEAVAVAGGEAPLEHAATE